MIEDIFNEANIILINRSVQQKCTHSTWPYSYIWRILCWHLHLMCTPVCNTGHFLSSITLSHKVKTQYVHFRLRANYFLLPLKISEEISRRNQCFSITQVSINHIKLMSIQTFIMGENWPEIGCLMEVSIINLIFAHTAGFTLYGTLNTKGSMLPH